MKIAILICVLMLALLAASIFMARKSFSANGDLEIFDVDPVQVVWGQPALILNKAGALRVMVYSTFSSRVWADINVTYDFGRQWYTETGPTGIGVPINPGYNWVWIPGGPIYPASDYLDPWIPSTTPPWLFWTKTGIDNMIRAEIDPFDEIVEADENNNLLTYPPVEVIVPRPLRILLAPLADHNFPTHIPRSSVEKNLAFLKETFPLGENSLSWAMRDQVYGHESYYDFDYTDAIYEDIVRDLSVEARVLGYDRLVVVYQWGVIGGCAVGMLREPEDRVPVVVSLSGLDYGGSEDLVAHELGHTFYLWHPFDIGPPIYDATRYRPTWRDYERTLDTFMDWTIEEVWIDRGRFCSDSKTWIDLGEVGTWQWNLWEQLTTDEIRVPIMILTGWIFKMGGAIFDHDWYHVSSGIPDLRPFAGAPQEGNYSITFLDGERQILSRAAFNSSFTYYVVPQNHTLIEKQADKIPFIFNMPYVNGTKFVQIHNSTGFLLDEKAITDHTPTVDVMFPNGGEELVIGSNCTIAWEAHDADGDNMHFLIAYSPDEGDTWVPVVSELNQTSFVWNTSMLSAGTTYLIKVTATDGFNTGEDQSNSPFAALDFIPPIITNVTQYPPPEVVAPDQNVTVHATVYDANSGLKNVTLACRHSVDNVTWSDWANATMNPALEDSFTGIIPALPMGTHVQYQIFARDASDNLAVNSNVGAYFVYSVIPELPSIAALSLAIAATFVGVILTRRKFTSFVQNKKKNS